MQMLQGMGPNSTVATVEMLQFLSWNIRIYWENLPITHFFYCTMFKAYMGLSIAL